MIFVRGGRLGLPSSSRVALAWHTAMGNTPFGVSSPCQRGATPASACRSAGIWAGPRRRRRSARYEAWQRAGAAALTWWLGSGHAQAISQRSLHNAPIFRLLLKVAVNGTHQCDFPNFCGQQCPTLSAPRARVHAQLWPLATCQSAARAFGGAVRKRLREVQSQGSA